MTFLEQPEKMPQGLREAVESTIKEDGVEAGIRVIATQQNCSMQDAEDYLVAAGVLEVREEETDDSDDTQSGQDSQSSDVQSDEDSGKDQEDSEQDSDGSSQENKESEEKAAPRQQMLQKIFALITKDNDGGEATEADKNYMAEAEKLDDERLEKLLADLEAAEEDLKTDPA